VIQAQEKYSINDEDDHELLGYVVQDSIGWVAQTIFGYPIARATNQAEAGKIVLGRGRTFLKGVWQYLDPDDQQWFPCIIKSATDNQVTVTRTNAMGMQEIDDSKLVIIRNPSELSIQKT
jgi:hypothetical protein